MHFLMGQGEITAACRGTRAKYVRQLRLEAQKSSWVNRFFGMFGFHALSHLGVVLHSSALLPCTGFGRPKP
jgi:hypothetical protein